MSRGFFVDECVMTFNHVLITKDMSHDPFPRSRSIPDVIDLRSDLPSQWLARERTKSS
jgi:hypothetical protein